MFHFGVLFQERTRKLLFEDLVSTLAKKSQEMLSPSLDVSSFSNTQSHQWPLFETSMQYILIHIYEKEYTKVVLLEKEYNQ